MCVSILLVRHFSGFYDQAELWGNYAAHRHPLKQKELPIHYTHRCLWRVLSVLIRKYVQLPDYNPT